MRNGGGGWTQALVALTDSHLMWWDTVPSTPQMWSLPTRSLRLIQTRLVNHRSPIYQTEQYSICIRYNITPGLSTEKITKILPTICCRHGGEEGVTCNVIALDSKSDQGRLWLKSFWI